MTNRKRDDPLGIMCEELAMRRSALAAATVWGLGLSASFVPAASLTGDTSVSFQVIGTDGSNYGFTAAAGDGIDQSLFGILSIDPMPVRRATSSASNAVEVQGAMVMATRKTRPQSIASSAIWISISPSLA